MKTWTASDLTNEIPLSADILEFQDAKGEWHDFHIVCTPERVIFGGVCNVGFIESGYLERGDGESLDDSLIETLADLECYYNDGPTYTSRIVFNDRM